MRLRYSFLCGLAALLLAPALSAQTAFINEIHYDNVGADENEAVEIAVPTGTDISTLTLTLYNGNGGVMYEPSAAIAFTAGATVDGYTLYSTPVTGIQNGSPDGLALSTTGGTLIQFLSYEGVFAATDGPASGATSTDIGVEEVNSAVGTSLQLTGTGTTYASFSWTGPVTATLGAVNAGQTFGTSTSTNPAVSFTDDTESVNESETAELTVQIVYPASSTSSGDVVVRVAYMDGSATAADFTSPTTVDLTFASGADETQDATFTLAQMDGFEGLEEANFVLTIVSGTADLGSETTATIEITDDEAPPTVTIAAARAQGVGSTVQIEGTVTRAKGAFVFLQDATAGLVIRQLAPQAGAPALADAVANGDVAPGTVLRVTGTLTEFNGLLQINSDSRDDNLASYEVIGTMDVPEAQVVTLAMIAANGESYESELIRVENVRFADAGNGQFAARTTYQLTDASDATNTVAVRTPNADDTAIDDGVNIPGNLANVTGVVGQFDNSDPRNSGYQIQPIAATDVVAVTGVATEDGEAAQAMLTVANPLQGSTTVRFATGVAGRASLSLYDALGRQVVTLVDGAVDGSAQTVTLDAGTLASGVYVLRLQGENVSISRTLTVVR